MKKILAGPGKIEWNCLELGAATHKIHRARRGWSTKSLRRRHPGDRAPPRHRANRARDRKCFARSDFQISLQRPIGAKELKMTKTASKSGTTAKSMTEVRTRVHRGTGNRPNHSTTTPKATAINPRGARGNKFCKYAPQWTSTQMSTANCCKRYVGVACRLQRTPKGAGIIVHERTICRYLPVACDLHHIHR